MQLYFSRKCGTATTHCVQKALHGHKSAMLATFQIHSRKLYVEIVIILMNTAEVLPQIVLHCPVIAVDSMSWIGRSGVFQYQRE